MDVLGFSINVTNASGQVKQLLANSPRPGDRPMNVQFASQRMTGFSTCTFELARRIDGEDTDLSLLDAIEVVGDDGSTAWEGRIGALPRSATVEGQYRLGVQCGGWIAHAKDRKFTQIYVDRELSQWGDSSRPQQTANIVAGYSNVGPTRVGDESGDAAVKLAFTGAWVATGFPISEAMYDAGAGNEIGSVYYEWTKGANVNAGDAAWTWIVKAATSDNLASGEDTTADLRAAGPGSGTLTTSTSRRFAFLRHYYSAAGGAAGTEYNIDWRNLAVYGRHGLTPRGTSPGGLYVSDVLRHIFDTYCPALNIAGIQNNETVVPHLTFRDPIDPYDAAGDLNKYTLWDLAVFDNQTVYYTPLDLTDYDWEIRLTDPGTSTTLQGDSVEDLANGVCVTYQDVDTGRQGRLTPEDYAELADDSVENPANQHGYPVWTEYQISFPTTLGTALQIGRAALAEFNMPKAPGQITVGPYIRDRAGHMQPYWKARSGDRVSITSSASLSNRPRVVNVASHSQSPGGGGQATLEIDSTFRTLPAIIDRLTTALVARGLQ